MTRSQKWLTRLNEIIEETPKKQRPSNQMLAQKLEISECDLFRKIKEVTGLSPQKFLRRYYLEKSMKDLKAGTYNTVKEASNAIGYSSVSYFIKQFEKEFGQKPLKVLKEQGWR